MDILIVTDTYTNLPTATVEDLTLTWGAGSGSVTGSNVTLKVIRDGNLCTLMLTARVNITFGAGDQPNLIIPVGYRPNVGVGGLSFAVGINNPAVSSIGFFEIDTLGNAYWYGNTAFGTFSAGAGWVSPMSVTYILA